MKIFVDKNVSDHLLHRALAQLLLLLHAPVQGLALEYKMSVMELHQNEGGWISRYFLSFSEVQTLSHHKSMDQE